MGRAMSEAVPAARDVYERAAEAAGLDLAALCFEGPIERLSETDVTQPALVTHRARLPARADGGRAHAGLRRRATPSASTPRSRPPASIDDRTAAHLTRERGLATAAAAAATPGAMAAVIGLDDAEVERLCDGIEGVWAANYNCPGQVVVSGTARGRRRVHGRGRDGRRAARRQAQGLGRLPQPAHGARGRAPAARCSRRPTFAEPRAPFFSTVTCRLEGARDLVPILLQQLTAPVRFTQAVIGAARPRRAHVRRGRPGHRALRPDQADRPEPRRRSRSSAPEDIARAQELVAGA